MRRGEEEREGKRGGGKRERSNDPTMEESQRDRNSLERFTRTCQARGINRNPRKKGKWGQRHEGKWANGRRADVGLGQPFEGALSSLSSVVITFGMRV